MFYLFAGYDYYPCGGVDDFKAQSAVIQDLLDKTVGQSEDWWHIADENMNIVETSYGGY